MILVFGKEGQLANELDIFPNTLCVGRSSCDLISDDCYIDLIMNKQITAVINASGYTDTVAAEQNIDDAMKLNHEIPVNIFHECLKKNIPFIHISTDYVFDGFKQSPYNERDKPNPIGAYGISKFKGEQSICELGGNFVIIRSSWLFSSYGKNFVKTMIEKGKNLSEVSVVCDQIGGPTSVRSLAHTCIKVLQKMYENNNLSGIYHFTGKPYISWADFAKEIFTYLDWDIKVKKIKSTEVSNNWFRPLNTMLDCSKIFNTFEIDQPEWKTDMIEVIKKLQPKYL